MTCVTLTKQHIAALQQNLRSMRLDGDIVLYIDAQRAREAFELGLAPFCPLSRLWSKDFIACEVPK